MDGKHNGTPVAGHDEQPDTHDLADSMMSPLGDVNEVLTRTEAAHLLRCYPLPLVSVVLYTREQVFSVFDGFAIIASHIFRFALPGTRSRWHSEGPRVPHFSPS
jgi:hypothetical protein